MVMAATGDPLLLVTSLARPGGNVTGLSVMILDLGAKRIEWLTELVPAVTGVAALSNMSNPSIQEERREIETATRSKGLRYRLFDVRQGDDIRRAFEALDRENEAIVVGMDAVTQEHQGMIVELAARNRVAAIYFGREFVDAGGLMSYGPNYPDNYHRAAKYVAKILKGAKPADLPVEQPTKFELVINLKIAKGLGLQIPDKLLALADEVID